MPLLLAMVASSASSASSPSAGISVIIPTYNEESVISSTISAVYSHSCLSCRAAISCDICCCRGTSPEVLVVDGGSSDGTVAAARSAGATRVLQVSGGRARQLNAGAAAASGSTLLFLHADSIPPHKYPAYITDALKRPHTVAGAFKLRIASPWWPLRIVEMVTNTRAALLQIPYGDQGLFLTRDRFRAVGGYPLIAFMDDYAMSQKLAKVGRIRIANAAVTTSPRRWETVGFMKTSVLNQIIVFAYHLGVPVHVLGRWYRGAMKSALMNKKTK